MVTKKSTPKRRYSPVKLATKKEFDIPDINTMECILYKSVSCRALQVAQKLP